MKVGDQIQISRKAWLRFLKITGPQAGQRLVPGNRTIVAAKPNGNGRPGYMLEFPVHWWEEDDLMEAPDETGKKLLEAAIEHADYRSTVHIHGTAFADSQAQIAVWLKELLAQKYPEPLPPEGNVTSLDKHRIRADKEFEDEQVAYLEVLWGKETYSFNAAVRNLELMRRGRDNGALRPPETEWEASHMVHHVRSLANDLARFWGMDHMVRADDDRVAERAPKEVTPEAEGEVPE